MPQMAPLAWLALFSFFTLALMLFSIMNFYSTVVESSQSDTDTHVTSSTLKWMW